MTSDLRTRRRHRGDRAPSRPTQSPSERARRPRPTDLVAGRPCPHRAPQNRLVPDRQVQRAPGDGALRSPRGPMGGDRERSRTSRGGIRRGCRRGADRPRPRRDRRLRRRAGAGDRAAAGPSSPDPVRGDRRRRAGLPGAPTPGSAARRTGHGDDAGRADAVAVERRRAGPRRVPDRPTRGHGLSGDPARRGGGPAAPIERYADQAFLASLGGAALSAATTRRLQRASAMLQAGLPKAARYGREGFAAHLGRVLTARGILPLDSGSLRLLDRVDCVVLDADLLVRDEFELTAVTALGSADADDSERMARRLFDRGRPASRRRRGQWTLAPLEVLGLEAPPGSKRLAGRMAKRGVALGLTHRGRLVALAGAEPAPRAGSEELVTACRGAGLQVVVAADDPGRAARLHPDRVVPGSSRLPRAIRALQRAGRVVLVVAGGGSPALPAADVALGLRLQNGPPPWGADLLSEDDDLSHAYLLVQACATARQVSRQSVLLAGAGAGASALAGSLGLASQAAQRTMDVVNMASAAALANGTRIAVGLARRPLPVWRVAVPWHELDASEALTRLGTSPAGLSEEQAALRRPPEIRSPSGALLLARSVTAELLNPLTPILGAGAGLAATVGSVTDAGLIGSVMVLNALVGGVEGYRARGAIERLEGRSARGVLVRRAGEERVVDAGKLVVGDVVRLRVGESVAADCRIMEASSLEMDESSLTGESLPVPKAAPASFAAVIAGRTSVLYEGTAVSAGEATAVVVATRCGRWSTRGWRWRLPPFPRGFRCWPPSRSSARRSAWRTRAPWSARGGPSRR